MMKPLNRTLFSAPSRPEGILQFGTGTFLRGFFAAFIQEANEKGAMCANIVVVGSTAKSGVAKINAQGGLFTLCERGLEEGQAVDRCCLVDSTSRALSAQTEWAEILETAENPTMQLVVSNTTEVGIAFDEADSVHAFPPVSFPAKLTAWLLKRATNFAFNPEYAPVILPCELIENNGDRLKEIVQKWAAKENLGSTFFAWLEHVKFCNTLVDQIVTGVPSTEAKDALEAQLGYQDDLLTVCEPYRLFAIQGDEIVAQKLQFPLATDRVKVVADIEPFRERKVHILNGTHTISAFKAMQTGCETVREAMEHPEMGAFMRNVMMQEIVPCLHAADADLFAKDTLDRFANPFIVHPWANITLHCTQKMAVRIVPLFGRFVQQFQHIPPFLVEGFAAFLKGRRAPLGTLPQDEGAAMIQEAWQKAQGNERVFAQAVCQNTTLWNGVNLAQIGGFVDAVAAKLENMPRLNQGVAKQDVAV